MLTGGKLIAFPPLISQCIRTKLVNSNQFYLIQRKLLTSSVVRQYSNTEKVFSNSDNHDITPAQTATVQTFSKDSVANFVSALSPEQRGLLLEEIHYVNANEVKKKAEEKLASWRWRSRFGRPTSVHQLGADPTGTYCEIPQDWLKKKVAEKSKARKPSPAELRHLTVFNALPFIGFGFLDNFIMIVAGDYIDITIGVGLGISTMAAAALGNTVSDLAGIGSAWYVENVAVKIGYGAPNLSQEQLEMRPSRWCSNLGRGAGVVIGCLLGMFPLLFLSKHEDKKDTEENTNDGQK